MAPQKEAGDPRSCSHVLVMIKSLETRTAHSPNNPMKNDPRKMKLPREPTPVLL